MITRPLPLAYSADGWLGRSGKASWYPVMPVLRARGNHIPSGALQPAGTNVLGMLKPSLMMDPSDPSTWQRQYRFTGGTMA